jgi:integrase
MKNDPSPPTAALATLKDVLDRLATNLSLSETRKRDLRSACLAFGKLTGRAPAMMPLDLAAIRTTLDAMVPAQAKVSPKRFANLRSDLGSAIEASGLRPMIKTAGVELSESWSRLFEGNTKEWIRWGLSRFARWASLRQIVPTAVDAAVIGRFIADLETASLTRNIRNLHRGVINSWNGLVRLRPDEKLQLVEFPTNKSEPGRAPWDDLQATFRADVDAHLAWAARLDRLDDNARERALAPRTLNLRQDHIHSAVTAAVSAGIEVQRLTSLASLVEVETYRALLRQRLGEGSGELTAYTHGIAGTLIAIAKEWVMVPPDILARLKDLRRKLGSLPSGLTEKNKDFLRQFDDPRRLDAILGLPDKLWRQTRRELATSRRPFIDLQSALAIDLLLHMAPRMENLSALNFEKHLHWPQGRGKPALMVFKGDEVKNRVPLEFEIPTELAERLQIYRNEIAPAVTGKRPDAVFVTWTGEPRTQSALTVAIEKTVLRQLGIRITPHQFRHLAAKIDLDANPGAYEQPQQLLGHRNTSTTMDFYGGINTRRAGRAHADLVMKLRKSGMSQLRSRRKTRVRTH